MEKLSKECLEAINANCFYPEKLMFKNGAIEALTNPAIYTKAGLVKANDNLLAILVQKYPGYDIKEANPNNANALLQAIGMCWKAVDLSKLTDEEIDFIHKTVQIASS